MSSQQLNTEGSSQIESVNRHTDQPSDLQLEAGRMTLDRAFFSAQSKQQIQAEPGTSCQPADGWKLHGEKILDPNIWLEEVYSPASSDFVEKQNSRTIGRFGGELFEALRADFTRLSAAGNFSMPQIGRNVVIKHTVGPDSPKGKILIADRDVFLRDRERTDFEVLLDIDQLAKEEGTDWVLAGTAHKLGIGDRMIVYLSRNGSDATIVREFDISRRAFLGQGLDLKEGYGQVAYFGDGNTIVFARADKIENRPDVRCQLEVKVWDRSGSIENARLIYHASNDSTNVSFAVREIAPNDPRIFIFHHRNSNGYTTSLVNRDLSQLAEIPFISKKDILEIGNGLILFRPRDSFILGEREYKGGLVAFNLEEFLANKRELYTGVFQVKPNQSVESAFTLKKRVYVHYLEDVASRICVSQFKLRNLKSEGRTPDFREIPIPRHGSVVSFRPVKGLGIVVGYTDFVTPHSYYIIQPGARELGTPFLQPPSKFDTSNVNVSQKWAVSADGTRVPFFVLDGRTDRSQPAATILYGYGGFAESMRPEYCPVRTAGWLNRGGVYVVANLRGGDEFGPSWWRAALGENRIKAYQDCAAIADQICKLGLSTPEKLGVMGFSNGGLMAGNMVTMFRERFRAAFCGSPLLDMLRYDQLLHGRAWVGEYGSPQEIEHFQWLKRYSPYHNLHADVVYPAVLCTTRTSDNRVHPAHARKMVRRMQDMQIPDSYLYEHTAGGHEYVDLKSWISEYALVYTFFHQMLGTPRPGS